jgi:hypothetical protein
VFRDTAMLISENEKKKFFSETRNLFEPKLYINNHWMVPYKTEDCVAWKSKNTTTA